MNRFAERKSSALGGETRYFASIALSILLLFFPLSIQPLKAVEFKCTRNVFNLGENRYWISTGGRFMSHSEFDVGPKSAEVINFHVISSLENEPWINVALTSNMFKRARWKIIFGPANNCDDMLILGKDYEDRVQINKPFPGDITIKY